MLHSKRRRDMPSSGLQVQRVPACVRLGLTRERRGCWRSSCPSYGRTAEAIGSGERDSEPTCATPVAGTGCAKGRGRAGVDGGDERGQRQEEFRSAEEKGRRGGPFPARSPRCEVRERCIAVNPEWRSLTLPQDSTRSRRIWPRVCAAVAAIRRLSAPALHILPSLVSHPVWIVPFLPFPPRRRACGPAGATRIRGGDVLRDRSATV
jgi:hypothetical protein